MKIIRIQILTNKPEKRQKLVDKIKDIEYVRTEPPIEMTNGDLKKSFKNDRSDVVLISEQYMGNGYKASQEIKTHYPNKTTLIIKDSAAKPNIRETLASGASDIIPYDVNTQYLTNLIYNAYMDTVQRQDIIKQAQEQKTLQQGKIIATFSTKGGTGKTLIATNLAVMLAQTTDKTIVLLDLNLEYGGSSLALNIQPRTSISDAINDIHHIDTDLMQSYLTTHSESGLKILASNPNPNLTGYISAEQVDIILKTLKQMFDYIIVDMPDRFMETLNPVFTLAHIVLLITTPEILALKNAKMALTVFKELGYPLYKVKIILNKASKRSITRRDAAKTLAHDILIEIPEDTNRVIQSQNEGTPYVNRFPRTPITRGFGKIISLILDEQTSDRKGQRR